MKRSPMPPRSKPMKRVAMKADRKGLTDEQRAIRQAVFDRDGGCIVHRPRCTGRATVHHLVKAGQGGLYRQENLVTLCVTMNEWVEDHPDEAWALGLVCRRGETLAETWLRMAEAGLVSGAPSGDPNVLNERRT